MSMSMSAPPAGAAATDPGSDPTAGASSDTTVLVTICSDGNGGYLVYSGEAPDSGSGDTSSDDADAMGSAGDATATPSAQGQPADSVGAALKATLTILQAAASSAGGPGTADDQMNAGFSGSQSPTPAGSSPAQKY